MDDAIPSWFTVASPDLALQPPQLPRTYDASNSKRIPRTPRQARTEHRKQIPPASSNATYDTKIGTASERARSTVEVESLEALGTVA